ncbi:hypothetical protein JW949_00855 [Candidatus Woesearchaeota archaeon]|nr:hypothetical protein [Candidatus Woesearchaeota archaeon]
MCQVFLERKEKNETIFKIMDGSEIFYAFVEPDGVYFKYGNLQNKGERFDENMKKFFLEYLVNDYQNKKNSEDILYVNHILKRAEWELISIDNPNNKQELSKEEKREIKNAFADYRGTHHLSSSQRDILNKYDLDLEGRSKHVYIVGDSLKEKILVSSTPSSNNEGKEIATRLIRNLRYLK